MVVADLERCCGPGCLRSLVYPHLSSRAFHGLEMQGSPPSARGGAGAPGGSLSQSHALSQCVAGRPPLYSGQTKAQDHPTEGGSAERLLRMLSGHRRCPGPRTLGSSVGAWPGVQPA